MFGVLKEPLGTNPCVAQKITNQLKRFISHQEFVITLSNPSNNWDPYLLGRKNIDSSQEPIYLSTRNRRTKVPWATSTKRARSLHWPHFPIYRENQWLMDHICWQASNQTWDRGDFNIPIGKLFMHSKDQLFKFAWPDKRGCATRFKWRNGQREPKLHWTVVPSNQHITTPLYYSTTLGIRSFEAIGLSCSCIH